MDTHKHGMLDRPVDGCDWCLGYYDGYTTGPDGVDPQGEPDDSEYVEGAAAGRLARPDRRPAVSSGASRNFDGKPETARDTRFYDLRESGYRGPIDQDGNAAPTGWMADILRCMAEQRGEEVNW